MPPLSIRLHSFLETSLSNGPGKRAVLWVQGCSLGCPGCFNPETHPTQPADWVPVDLLARRIQGLSASIEGITISGGEPLQQRRPLQALLERVRAETSLSVILFSGYTWEEIQRMPRIESLLALVDVLLAGRYIRDQHLGKTLLGSANKTIHLLSGRYTMADLEQIPPAEVIIDLDGSLIFSGIDPLPRRK